MVRRLTRLLVGCALAAVAAVAPGSAVAAGNGAGAAPYDVRLPRTVTVTEGSTYVTVDVTIRCDPGQALNLGGTLSSRGRFGNSADEGYTYYSPVDRHHGFDCTGEPQVESMGFYTLDPTTSTPSKRTSRNAVLSVEVHLQSDDGVGMVLLYAVPPKVVHLEVVA